jgi:hypothetical protein
MAGYLFTLLAGLVNVIFLIMILIKAGSADPHNRKRLLVVCGIMLLNIPAMLIYSFFAVKLLNTMRITFTNATPTIITDIHIRGCEKEYIPQLEAGQSKTVWISITGDCVINIDYLSNHKRQYENIGGYITNDMGQKIKHNIGGQNDDL